jgi:hypothetical protein
VSRILRRSQFSQESIHCPLHRRVFTSKQCSVMFSYSFLPSHVRQPLISSHPTTPNCSALLMLSLFPLPTTILLILLDVAAPSTISPAWLLPTYYFLPLISLLLCSGTSLGRIVPPPSSVDRLDAWGLYCTGQSDDTCLSSVDASLGSYLNRREQTSI